MRYRRLSSCTDTLTDYLPTDASQLFYYESELFGAEPLDGFCNHEIGHGMDSKFREFSGKVCSPQNVEGSFRRSTDKRLEHMRRGRVAEESEEVIRFRNFRIRVLICVQQSIL